MKQYFPILLVLFGMPALAEPTIFGVELGGSMSAYEHQVFLSEGGINMSTLAVDSLTILSSIAEDVSDEVVTVSNQAGEICLVVGFSRSMSADESDVIIAELKRVIEATFGPSALRQDGLFEIVNHSWGTDRWIGEQRVEEIHANNNGVPQFGAIQLGITRLNSPRGEIQVGLAFSSLTAPSCIGE